jgi:acetylornithine deacetylase
MSLKDILKDKLEENKDRYIRVLKELVKIDTRVVGHGIDGGYELNGQKYLEKIIDQMGGKTEYVEMKEEKIQEAIIMKIALI